MKRLFICSLVFIFFLQVKTSNAQQDSSALQISLLTCTPGSELYSVFGHSALRIVDSAAGTDIVYNFGTFDFNDPDFYTKFVRGKLIYFVSQVSYPDFLYEYQYFKRGVSEQVLNLPQALKKKIQSDLFVNIREENKYYKYDFLYDNCTTRLRDILLQNNFETAFNVSPVVGAGQTFRDHLHTYLDRAEIKWTALGIDLLLGIGADFPMTNMESMFLPDFLYKGIAATTTPNGKLNAYEVYPVQDLQSKPEKIAFYFQPLFAISIISIILLLATLLPSKNKSFQLLADRILFLVTGLFGLFLMFMWFGTDHQSFSKNINLIWALPLNIFFAYHLNSPLSWMKLYFKIWSIILLILIAVSLLYIGIINISLYPLILFLSFRYWVLSKN
ncbi:MAG: DUF4105 domain-containing protein [Chitinophagaceae bacterium]